MQCRGVRDRDREREREREREEEEREREGDKYGQGKSIYNCICTFKGFKLVGVPIMCYISNYNSILIGTSHLLPNLSPNRPNPTLQCHTITGV